MPERLVAGRADPSPQLSEPFVMQVDKRFSLLLLPLALAACVSIPEGPSVMVLPGSGMSFEQFRQDEFQCRDYATQQINQMPQSAADNTTVRSAAVGTIVGALAGAAIGGRRGAGVGAGTGLIIGGASGAGASQVSGHEAQRRYDNAFVQCMYAKGHRVPVSGNYGLEQRQNMPAAAPSAPATANYPPPPPPPAGTPPPPPR